MSARQISASVAHGLHGRRRAGHGETFWQFRRFQSGEPARRIDWRRSARDDHLYVREREWEAAHTVWLWPDLSPSMDYRSRLAPVSKRDRALVIALALADLVVRGGERVAVPGAMAPSARRRAAELVAHAISLRAGSFSGFPDIAPVRRFSDLVIIGDFLDPIAGLADQIARAAGEGIAGHLVMIVDPAEESFPFEGRTEFTDPEGGPPITFGSAAEARDHFVTRMQTRRRALRDALDHAGWSLLVHHTDQPPTQALMALHARLSGHFDTRKAAYRETRPQIDEALT
ncbi:MAG: DUF58 domain-containing protein [Rhodobiaceae bacterium]|nr:DUF58 domain-containing protein [Rhodobiaceae bacterium]MCC0056386.1 DUF58 domain-containing protein [Rhodobiaceae bacterium]